MSVTAYTQSTTVHSVTGVTAVHGQRHRGCAAHATNRPEGWPTLPASGTEARRGQR